MKSRRPALGIGRGSIAALFLLLCASSGAFKERSQDFVEIAYLPQGLDFLPGLSAYDTDQDSFEEVIFTVGGSVQFYEHRGNNQYWAVHAVSGRLHWAVGDLDDDGLTDMVVSRFDSLEVFESPAPDSYPGHCVWRGWEIPYPANAPRTWITDLDQDGRKEMLVSNGARWVCIFENTGDNTYTKVFEDYIYPHGVHEMGCGDFDLDGKSEFVSADINGNVIVYENMVVGVDSFAITWIGWVPTAHAYSVAAANDMDADGKPEFVVLGHHRVAGGERWVCTLFETIGDDMYEPVWCDSSFPLTSFIAQGDVDCGDVDADGVDEMAVSAWTGGVYLYKCTGPDTYERVWQFPLSDPVNGVIIYDLNRNGYGEIVLSGLQGTWIYEKEGVGIEEPNSQLSMTNCQLLQNYPNPFGAGGTIVSFTVTREPCTIFLGVCDLSGRIARNLVEGMTEPGHHTVVWDGRDEYGYEVPGGVYFCRLWTGNSRLPAVRKMVIVR